MRQLKWLFALLLVAFFFSPFSSKVASATNTCLQDGGTNTRCYTPLGYYWTYNGSNKIFPDAGSALQEIYNNQVTPAMIQQYCTYGCYQTQTDWGLFNNIEKGFGIYANKPNGGNPTNWAGGSANAHPLCRENNSNTLEQDSNGYYFYMCLDNTPMPYGHPSTTPSAQAFPTSTIFKKDGCPNSCDPVDLGTVTLNDYKIDYENKSPYPIIWSRRYLSTRKTWIFNYDKQANAKILTDTSAILNLFREDGQQLFFNGSRPDTNSNWTWTLYIPPGNSAPSYPSVSQITSTPDLTQIIIKNSGDEIENYQNGLLQSMQDVHGNQLIFQYDMQNRLTKITDSVGRYLKLNYSNSIQQTQYVSGYDAQGNPIYAYYSYYNGAQDMINDAHPETITDGDQIVGYTYQPFILSAGSSPYMLLSGVIYPDSTTVLYQYDSTGRWINTIDQSNLIYQTYTYNNYNQITSTSLGNNQDTYSYISTQMTYPNGLKVSYTFNPNGQMTSSTRPCPTCNDYLGKTVQYDTSGNPSSITDFKGNVEKRTYDLNRSLLLSKTEAYGSAQSRTSTYQWDSRFRLPIQRVIPVQTPNGAGTRTDNLTYDDHGNLLTVSSSVTGPNSYQLSRSATFTYNTAGQVLTAQDANGNTTTYTYDGQNNLSSTTNPANQTVNLGGYDAVGSVGWIQYPNHYTVKFTYDAMERVSQIQKGCDPSMDALCHWETYTISYTPFGAVQTMRGPDGTGLTYHYDTAHRLIQTDALDSSGNVLGSVVLTLSVSGEVTNKTYKDAAGNTLKQANFTYDDLSRVKSFVDQESKSFSKTRDDEDNLISTQDPLNHGQANQYDALNRLVQATLSDNSTQKIQYGANDEVTSLTDNLNHSTTYTYNGFGDVVGIQSPDSGNTVLTLDNNGNVLIKTDARGKTLTTTYDALDRPLLTTSSSGESIQRTYDACQNGVGKLCSITDITGTTAFKYDPFGRVIEKDLGIGTRALSLIYSYNNQGQLTDIQYPSGKTLHQTWSNGEIQSLSWSGTPLLSSATYDPFGTLTGWTWASGRTVQYQYDSDGRLSQIQQGSTARAFTRDDAWRLGGINQSNPAVSLSYGYDNRDRLTTSNNWGTYSYDTNSNRLSWLGSLGPTAYSISPTSNQITSINGTPISLDASGNVLTTFNGLTLTYDDWNRMRSSTLSGVTTTYGVNGLGERVRKTQNGSSTYFVYSQVGQLMGVYDANGNALEEFAYLDGQVVSDIRGMNVYNVETDQIKTPLRVLDSSNNVVWSWEDREPFGASNPISNAVGGQPFVFNLQFPGQYYDNESGLVYNGYRDYNPSLGRYMEVDPLGLNAGMNPYGYVSASPLDGVDPTGLACIKEGINMICSTQDGPTFTVPAPPGDFGDLKGSNSHFYDIPVPLNGANPDAVWQQIVNNPTPGSPRPATPNGTLNNASPTTIQGLFDILDGIGDGAGTYNNSPVISYLTVDQKTGNPLVVNVTLPGHPLYPGYVAREICNGIVHNYGEGTGFLQSRYNFLKDLINNVWKPQTKALIQKTR